MSNIYAFSGLDGAGKSTQIDLLKEYLEKSEHKVLIFWGRGGYTPGMELLKKILRKSNAPIIPKEGGKTSEREEKLKSSFTRKVWLYLAVLDLFLYYSIYMRYKRLIGYSIILDRYLVDTEIDFRLNFPKEKVTSWFIWRMLNKIAPSPDFHFLLTIPVEESLRRSKLKNEPFPDTPEVLSFRLKKYTSLSKNYYHINCMNPLEKVSQEIQNTIGL